MVYSGLCHPSWPKEMDTFLGYRPTVLNSNLLMQLKAVRTEYTNNGLSLHGVSFLGIETPTESAWCYSFSMEEFWFSMDTIPGCTGFGSVCQDDKHGLLVHHTMVWTGIHIEAGASCVVYNPSLLHRKCRSGGLGRSSVSVVHVDRLWAMSST
jgi:hypothetical protein